MIQYLNGLHSSCIAPGDELYKGLTQQGRADRDGVQHRVEKLADFINKEVANQAIQEGAKVAVYAEIQIDPTTGEPWTPGAYGDLIRRNFDSVEWATSLDHGEQRANLESYQKTAAMGATVVPVIGFGTHVDYVKYYVQSAGRVAVSVKGAPDKTQLRHWLDSIWAYAMTDSRTGMCVQAHMLDSKDVKILADYPWYSASTNHWSTAARSGSIILADGNQICIAKKHEYSKTAGRHYKTLGRMERHCIADYIDQRGYQPGELADHLCLRMAFNAKSCDTQSESKRYYATAVEGLF